MDTISLAATAMYFTAATALPGEKNLRSTTSPPGPTSSVADLMLAPILASTRWRAWAGLLH
eukprot:9083363-Pyramimonas_sp.AAC.1